MRLLVITLMLLIISGLGYRHLTAPAGHPRLGASSGNLVVDTAALDFGAVPIGKVEERTLVATNVGDEPLEGQSVVVPAPFTAKPSSFRLEPGASRVLTVRFSAKEAGEHRDAVLTIAGSSDRPLEVALRGVAARPPELAIEPLSLGFGAVSIGNMGRGVVTLVNRGDLPLHVASIGSPQPFRTELSEVTLAPHEQRTVTISYAPDTANEHRGELLVRSDDPVRGVVTVGLKGKGVGQAPKPLIEAHAEALDFGRVSIGTKRDQYLWIRNRGVDTLHLTSVTAGAPFTVSSRSLRVAPGKAARISIAFSPDEEGGRLVPLVIHNDDPAHQVLIVSLVGEGTRGASTPAPPDAAAEAAAREFGSVIAGNLKAAVPGEPADDATTPATDLGVPDALPQGDLLSEKGGYVYVGTLRTAISSTDLQSWSFDATSGQLSIAGFTPPPVQFPFGQYFEFAPIDIQGVVSSTGDFSAPATLTMINESGTTMNIVGKFTTGDATFETNGVQATRSGSSLDTGGDGRLVFVGIGPDGTPAQKVPIVIEIPVQQALQTTGDVANAQ